MRSTSFVWTSATRLVSYIFIYVSLLEKENIVAMARFLPLIGGSHTNMDIASGTPVRFNVADGRRVSIQR